MIFPIILLLVCANALYVLAEFGVVASRPALVRKYASRGKGLARRVLPIVEDSTLLDQYIATCQVGITLSSLILGAYGQATLTPLLSPLLAEWFGWGKTAAVSISAGSILVVLTGFQMVLGELVPKSVALQFPLQAASFTVLPVQLSRRIFGLFVTLLNESGMLILKALKVPAVRHHHAHSPRELDFLISESHQLGVLDEKKYFRLKRALRLGEYKARDLMLPRPYIIALDLDKEPDEILEETLKSPFTRLPAYRTSLDNTVGILHSKDLARHYVLGEFEDLKPLLRPVHFLPESLPADRVLEELRRHHTHLALIVDEFGIVVGLITWQDILAEILGSLSDTYKGGQARPQILPDNRVRLPGLMQIQEARRWIGPGWQGEATTVGGYVVEVLGRFPEEGEKVLINGVTTEIERVSNQAIMAIIVTPISGED